MEARIINQWQLTMTAGELAMILEVLVHAGKLEDAGVDLNDHHSAYRALADRIERATQSPAGVN